MIHHRSYAHTGLGAVVKLKPENIQTWTGFEPMTSAIPAQYSTHRAIKPTRCYSRCRFVRNI